MKDEDVARVQEISRRYSWRNLEGKRSDFLSEEELSNLTIRYGTLTADERQVINHHIFEAAPVFESKLSKHRARRSHIMTYHSSITWREEKGRSRLPFSLRYSTTF